MTTNNNDGVVYMKLDGQVQVAPEIMTATEAIAFLRLDEIPGLKNPEQSLLYYRNKGLRAVKIGKALRYPKKELFRFIDVLLEEADKQSA